jgi:hypothetical protein
MRHSVLTLIRSKEPSPCSLIWLRAKTNAKPEKPSNPAPSSNSNLRFETLAKYLRTVARSRTRFPRNPALGPALLVQRANARLLILFELIHRLKCSRNRNTQAKAHLKGGWFSPATPRLVLRAN